MYKLMTAAFLLAFSAAAAAEGPYVGVGGGVSQVLDTDLSASAGRGEAELDLGKWGALQLGNDLPGIWRVELEASYSTSAGDKFTLQGGTPGPATGHLNALGLLANFWMDFNTDGVVAPYIGLGIGAAQIEYDQANSAGLGPLDDEETVLAGQVGTGLRFNFSDNFTGSLDYRFFITDDTEYTSSTLGRIESEYAEHRAGLGIAMGFGGSETARVATAPVRDTDGDGVRNKQDDCPNTPDNQPVMTNGCAAKERVVLPQVQFEYKSTRLTGEAQERLMPVAQVLKDSPEFQVRLNGHTDNVGSDAYNQTLSQNRANSVRSYLVSKGVNAKQVSARGYGETRPIASNSTDAGRARNRRVELEVLRHNGK